MSFRPPSFQPTPTSKPIKGYFPANSVGTHSFLHFDVVQTPSYRAGLWQLSQGQRDNFKIKYGVNLPVFKMMLRDIFLNPMLDSRIAESIILLVHRFFPVRSGRLYGVFAKTFRIFRAQWYSTHLMVYFRYLWTPKRPYPIRGRVKHKGEFGWAEYYTPQRSIPNVHVVLRPKPPSKSALYLLDDPTAWNDPTTQITLNAQQEIWEDMKKRYDKLIYILNI